MITNNIDGFTFDLPLNLSQIKQLAKFHRNQLRHAIYHQDENIGEVGIIQRAKIAAFTKVLDPAASEEFYNAYNDELLRLADEDPIHPPHSEKGVSIFVLIISLVIAAVVLYFTFVSSITPTT